MRRSVVLTLAAAGLFAIAVLAVTTNVVQSVIPVTPYEADINKDARINSIDQLHLAKNYGLPVPTASPTATSFVRNRALLGRFAPGNQLPVLVQLLDTSNGQVLQSFPNGYEVNNFRTSCDGKYAAMIVMVDPQNPSAGGRTQVISMATGAVLAQTAVYNLNESAPSRDKFPCTLDGSTTPARAALANLSPSGFEMTLLNLDSGAVLFSDDTVNGNAFTFNCGQDVVMYQTYAIGVGDSDVKVIRLVDGSLVTSIPAPHFFPSATC